MSHSIYYKSMFIRTSDGKYIPMIEAGDSNTYCGNKRARDWHLRRPLTKEGEARWGYYAWTREEIMADLEAFIDDIKQTNVNRPINWNKGTEGQYWTYQKIEQKFSYFSGMVIYGRGGYTTAQQIRNFFQKGFDRAIDFQPGLLEISYWKGGFSEGEYKREAIMDEQHLADRWQQLRAEGVKEIYFDYTIHGRLLYDQQDRKVKKPSPRRKELHTVSISLRNPDHEPEHTMNYRDYEQEAKVGDRIILDGNGIISGFANASKSRSYKVAGRNDEGLLLKRYGGKKLLYVKDHAKDQRVGILTAQEFAALPY